MTPPPDAGPEASAADYTEYRRLMFPLAYRGIGSAAEKSADIVGAAGGGTADAPLCSPCIRPDAGFWRSCPGCGQEGRITAGRCVSCRLRQALRDLLGGPDGAIRPGLRALHDNLAGYERPATVLGWLRKSTAAAILRELGAGQRPLTHAALDELPDGKPLRHLRAVLVATGALPPRDGQLARLERWISWSVAERPDPSQRQLLHRYAVWHVVRRLPGRLDRAHATHGQVQAAIALLDWLTARDLTLARSPPRRPGGMAVRRPPGPPHRRWELRPLGAQAQADPDRLRPPSGAAAPPR